MPDSIPSVIARFMDAAAIRDYDTIGECFTEDATVFDEQGTHRGQGEIRQWQRDTRAKWDYTVTIAGGQPADANEYRLAAHLKGNFPGGEADVEYRFTIRDGRISSLRIA